MKILGIESSSLVASVAVVTDDVVTAEFTANFKKTHSQTLLPMLDQMGQLIELDMKTLDAIAVAAGPGSFTGLRIGAATAKGLGLALDKPLAAVPTLEALAYNLWGCSGVVCPMLDARRNQVYTGVYRVGPGHMAMKIEEAGNAAVSSTAEWSAVERTDRMAIPEVILDQCALDIAELMRKLEEIGEPVTFLGDGVPVFRARIEAELKTPYAFAPAQCSRQRAASVAALGAEYVKRGQTVTAAEFKPDYLRKSQAEREREERQDICVRPMTVADLQNVWQLERECFSDAWSMKLLADALANDYDHFWVAECGEAGGAERPEDTGSRGAASYRFCGYANLRILAGEGEIERIAVDPALRRRGAGRKLMEAMAEFAGKEGVGDMTLEVRAGNTAALKLYESCGFAEEGRRKDYYRNPTEDALILWRRGV